MEEIIETMDFVEYPFYKNSGVELLGDVPQGWTIKKLKHICIIFNGDSIKDETKKSYESDNPHYYPYISTKDIDLDFSKVEYENGLKIPRQNKFKIAPKNNVLICIEGGSAGKKIAFINQDVCFVNKLACFNANNTINSKYLFFFAKSQIFQNQFSLAMSGLIGGVAISLIKNFNIPLPPIAEQIAITEFLDKKIAQIDLTITQKSNQIGLLKERQHILIHTAVSHGLNQDVPTKDSGVEWIGMIPKHWEIARNRSLFEERNEPGNSSLPILSVSIHTAVSSEELSDDNNIRGKIRIEDKTSYKFVNVNDIAYNMMRAWQGSIGAVSTQGMVSPAYVVARPIGQINSEFFEYQYRTSSFIQQMDRFSKGITDFRKRLYWNEFKQLKTILPPINEQLEIVDFIKRSSNKIAIAITCKEKEIERLKEYKATLINTAVTGKIKVS